MRRTFLKERKRTRPKAELRTVLAELLPQRLAHSLAPDGMMANLRDRDLETLAARLKAWKIVPSGTEGYAKAEVTVGGVDTAGLSSRTMEANKVPGLFVIGEAVDVTGWLGGYNFQWAWSSRLGGGRGGLSSRLTSGGGISVPQSSSCAAPGCCARSSALPDSAMRPFSST